MAGLISRWLAAPRSTPAHPGTGAAVTVEEGERDAPEQIGPDAEQARSPTPLGVVARDVANCYQLFLGREPENDDVVREKVGQPRSDVLRGFIGSGEFEHVLKSVRFAEPLALRMHSELASPRLVDWATSFLSGDAPASVSRDRSYLSVLSEALHRAPVQEIVDELYGAGAAANLMLSARGIATRPRLPSLSHAERPYTTEFDTRNISLVLLGRSDADIDPDPTVPLFESVERVVASDEFRHSVVNPVLDGRLARDVELPASARDWVADNFGADHANRLKAVASILRHFGMNGRLGDRALGWQVEAVADALDATIIHAFRLQDRLAQQQALIRRASSAT